MSVSPSLSIPSLQALALGVEDGSGVGAAVGSAVGDGVGTAVGDGVATGVGDGPGVADGLDPAPGAVGWGAGVAARVGVAAA